MKKRKPSANSRKINSLVKRMKLLECAVGALAQRIDAIERTQRLPVKLPSNLITREQLARLRDEIETMFERCNKQLAQADKSYRVWCASLSNNEKMLIEIRDMRRMFGLDATCAAAPGQHVPTSLFHSALAQVYKRLKELEEQMQ